MDYYIDHLKLLIEQNGGIASAQDILKAGIDRALIYDSLAKGIVVKESHYFLKILMIKRPYKTSLHCTN